ncbi:DNA -binding domain-containing protein [Cupriavidus necator]|uniref:DNA -binding domain-containing protein n=1 Tax=Cupriavidus necator TaxID=106590 RepID=UPI003AF36F20
MLVHMQTLQALDGALTGASCREIAEVMMGPVAVARQWHADCALRSRVRRMVKRGERRMGGGYR